ncbi:hypothetical protein SNE40_020428 [Patella caerulea]|uniref:CHCH domain-containing protein n=1 Tax=Patella caerulea TaxID=87958 RepID=A0AAN8G4B7_PATCE
MSTQMTFHGKRTVKPPDKGSFPLDHEGECKDFMVKFMKCLRINGQENTKCREESKDYLHCRMERNLMAKEDWKKLGYHKVENQETT